MTNARYHPQQPRVAIRDDQLRQPQSPLYQVIENRLQVPVLVQVTASAMTVPVWGEDGRSMRLPPLLWYSRDLILTNWCYQLFRPI